MGKHSLIAEHLVSSRNIILGGDFSDVLNSKIGKDAYPLFGHGGSKEFSNLCNNYILVDIFRHLDPYKFVTTWHAPSSKDIHTRLGPSDSLISNDAVFNFYPVSFSDHDIFSFESKNFDIPEVGPS